MTEPSRAAQVGSEERLAELGAALATLAVLGPGYIAEMRQELRRRIDSLEDFTRDLERDEFWADDDSDPEEEEDPVEEAHDTEAQLEAAMAAILRVRDLWDAFDGCARVAEGLLDNDVPAQVTYLRAQVEELQSSARVQVPGIDSGTVARQVRPQSAPPPAEELPGECVWISLSEIDTESELIGTVFDEPGGRRDYNTYKSMMEVLWFEVLPCVKDDPGRGRDKLPSESSGARGMLIARHVFDAFFGDDCIYLERGRQSTKFSIVNGRHRIKMALDLGWAAVPARVKDLRARAGGR